MFGIGKNFEEKVKDAVEKLGPLGVRNAGASVNGKVVTLTGVAPDKAVKVRAMQVFNELVETENTINLLSIAAPAAGATPPVARNSGPSIGPHAPGSHEMGPAAPVAPRVHVVAKGDTLSAIAKTYYGKASQYPKIFEANRDILKDPDEIFPGQRLRIP